MSLDYERMHDISQQLSIGTEYGTWNPTRGYMEEDLTRLRGDAQQAMLDTSVGKALLKRGGPAMIDRVTEVFGQRYAGKFPSIHPFFEYLMEVAQDLLVELPPAAPKTLSIAETLEMEK